MFVKSPKVFETLNKLIKFNKSEEPTKSDSSSLVTKSSTLKKDSLEFYLHQID